jgi:hypothetical protein
VLGGLALCVVGLLISTGLWTDILRYRKDMLYLTKQHLVLVGISGIAAIVPG